MIDVIIYRDQEFTHVAVYNDDTLLFVKSEVLVLNKFNYIVKTKIDIHLKKSNIDGTLLSRTMDRNRSILRNRIKEAKRKLINNYKL